MELDIFPYSPGRLAIHPIVVTECFPLHALVAPPKMEGFGMVSFTTEEGTD